VPLTSRAARRREAYRRLVEQQPQLFRGSDDDPFRIECDDPAQDQVAAQTRQRQSQLGLDPDDGDVGVVYRDEYIALLRDAVRLPDGTLGSYIRIVIASEAEGAVVLPLQNGRLLLLRHFRHATRSWHWEAPRGLGDAGEQPEQTARRELAEECGLQASSLERLGNVVTDSGLAGHRVHLFVARVNGEPELQLDEGIDGCRWLNAIELQRWMAEGLLDDSLTISALALARAHGLL
jgi:ADP-ribose pyrophosphatase